MSAVSGFSSLPIVNPSAGTISNLSNNANISIPASSLNKADAMNSSLNSGSIPAVKPNFANRIGNTTVNLAKGAVNSTVTATRDMGNIIANDVLPKPEPLSTKLLRNRLLGAIVVGGFVNGINTAVKMAKGDYTQEQAVKAVIQDTSMGAITGLTFSGTMGLTASTLGRFIGGVPLSITALALGTLASIGITELVRENIPYFKK